MIDVFFLCLLSNPPISLRQPSSTAATELACAHGAALLSMPLLLPPLNRLTGSPSPSSPARTPALRQSNGSRHRHQLAAVARPQASLCSYRRMVDDLLEVESPYRGAHIGSRRPRVTGNTQTIVSYKFKRQSLQCGAEKTRPWQRDASSIRTSPPQLWKLTSSSAVK